MVRIAFGAIFLFLLSVSAFSATCNPKIEDTLCKYIANLGYPQTVPIKIVLPQPPFDYPDKTKVSQDSMRNYGLMVVDSVQRNLEAMKPAIDSLYAKYRFLTLKTPRQVITLSNISYDYVMYAISFPDTVLHLAGENLVSRIELLQSNSVANSTVPDFAILSTRFPYDTVLTGFARVLPDNSVISNLDTISIGRYGFRFRFASLPTPTICCPEPIAKDFLIWDTNNRGCSDIRFPSDSNQPSAFMSGGWYPSSCIPACTSFVAINQNYKSHEYRFQLHSAILYMKVMDVYGLDSMRIRFDTISFLSTITIQKKTVAVNKPASRISVVFENNLIVVRGIEVEEIYKVTIYDLSGRTVFGSAVNVQNGKMPVQGFRGKGIYVARLSMLRGDQVCVKCVW